MDQEVPETLPTALSRVPPVVTFADPSITALHAATLPTPAERREAMRAVAIGCWAGCGKFKERSKLMNCGKCKEAKYCSPECQKAHWKQHKLTCEPPLASGVHRNPVQRLATRVLAIPNLTDYIHFLACFTLDLLSPIPSANQAQAGQFAMELEVDTQAADMQEYLRRMMSGLGTDENAQRCFCLVRVRKVPMDEAPKEVKALWEEKFKKEKWGPSGASVVAAMWFTQAKSNEEKEADGKEDEFGEAELKEASETAAQPAAAPEPWVVPYATLITTTMLAYVRNKPTLKIRSSMMGDVEKEMTPSLLKDMFNNNIRMDKTNALRLRMYPTAERSVPLPRPDPVVITANK